MEPYIGIGSSRGFRKESALLQRSFNATNGFTSSHSIEKRSPCRESLTLQKVAAFVRVFKDRKGNETDTTVTYLRLL